MLCLDFPPQEVVRTKPSARECNLGEAGQCQTTVDDECACKVIVRLPNSNSTLDYQRAVQALVSMCGKRGSCSACPQLGVKTSWACLAPMGTKHCVPPNEP